MATTPFDRFGEFVSSANNLLEIAGRFSFQGDAEKHALHDIISKLALVPSDDLLEVGCGAGNLLIPLSFLVHSVTGVDHQNLLNKLKVRLPIDSAHMTLVPENFLTANIKKTFSKILIYSVIHYLKDEKDLATFIKKVSTLLRPGGIMLIGDIPNADKKVRFLASKKGKEFSAAWQRQVKSAGEVHTPKPADTSLIQVNDKVVDNMIHTLTAMGLSAQVVPQPESLPISHTREDVIAVRK